MTTLRAGAEPDQAMKPSKILVIDIGGTHVKLLATGVSAPLKVNSGPSMTARSMVSAVKRLSADWSYEAVSIGYPGPVVHGRLATEPFNLGAGWVGFDFRKAFGKPVKVINDAAMQALGSYRGGRMLFLGLGTGLGTAMVVDGVPEPMELGHFPYRKDRTFEDYLGLRGLERLGRKKWERHVAAVTAKFKSALAADDVVLGGGNAKKLATLPPGARLGDNADAFVGGFRLWDPREHPNPASREQLIAGQ